MTLGALIHEFNWSATDYDQLAQGALAGHVIECGCQATGGNFSGFRGIANPGQPLGFPLAEVASDGSSVITKHDGTEAWGSTTKMPWRDATGCRSLSMPRPSFRSGPAQPADKNVNVSANERSDKGVRIVFCSLKED